MEKVVWHWMGLSREVVAFLPFLEIFKRYVDMAPKDMV